MTTHEHELSPEATEDVRAFLVQHYEEKIAQAKASESFTIVTSGENVIGYTDEPPATD